jgi:hypothetical protein
VTAVIFSEGSAICSVRIPPSAAPDPADPAAAPVAPPVPPVALDTPDAPELQPDNTTAIAAATNSFLIPDMVITLAR